jgi:hypothetical protein
VRELASMRPVLARLEGFDLFLALHDHAQRRRLHASGRESALHLAPQHRREVEADQVVERAPRLLRVDQVAGHLARMRDGFLDRARRDLGEHHAMQRLVLEQAALRRISAMCQLIASPSRSGSVARYRRRRPWPPWRSHRHGFSFLSITS